MTLHNTEVKVFTLDRLTDTFLMDKGVKQEDDLSATLFIVALEEIIKEINLKGLIIDKSVQILAYADHTDACMLARDKLCLNRAFCGILQEAKNQGLEIRQ